MLLKPRDRQLIDLRYDDPQRTDFALNDLTRTTNAHEKKLPVLTLFARPENNVELSVAQMREWLGENARGFDPVPHATFVPDERRGIVDGVLAFEGDGYGKLLERFLAVRRDASVEYLLVGSIHHEDHAGTKHVMIAVKYLVAQFAQSLRLLAAGSAMKAGPQWEIFVNARGVGDAHLWVFANGSRDSFPPRDDRLKDACLSENFQFVVRFDASTHSQLETVPREMDLRFEMAFGGTEARAYTREGLFDNTSINY